MVGRVGKTFSYAAWLILLGLSGCSGEAARFTGPVTVEQGTCALGFDATTNTTASLVLRGNDVQFAPSDGVIVLTGQIDGKGHVVASSNATGADRKPFPQVFEGDRDGDRVVGRFASPRCRANVVLTRR